MPSIQVNNLNLEFKIPTKEPGLRGAVKNLFSPTYITTKAVTNLTFTIESGELIGFIGPNGAGKTSTLKMLSGLLLPTSGQISVLGHKPFERKHTFLKDISLIMGQKNQLLWDLPATDTFLLNKEIYEVSDKRYKKVTDELIELLEVQDHLKTPARKLSLGQRMKMELIAALIHTPKVLFLDEPTIGLDVVVQRNLRDFIRDYNQRHEATILLTSHYMGDVQELCSRVIIISHGQILFDGKLDSLIEKYSPQKIVRIVLDDKVKQSDFVGMGEIHEWNFPNIALAVPREQAAKKAGEILQKFDVLDLNIEETPIEDIIRDIFHQV